MTSMAGSDATHAQVRVAAEKPQVNRLRRCVLLALKLLIVALVVYFVGRALVWQLTQVPWSQIRLRPAFFGLAIAVGGISSFISLIAYRRMVSGFTSPPSLIVLAAIAWVPALGKYVPGKFAAVAGAVWMFRQYNVPAAIGLSVVMIQLGLAILTGFIVALPLCFWQPVYQRQPYAWVWSVAVLVAGVASLHPRVLGPMANFALRRLGRPPLPKLPPLTQYLVPMLLMIIAWAVSGVAAWLTARSIVPISWGLMPIFMSATALASSLGTLALIPGGIGVREGVFLLVLTPSVGAMASVLALVLRLKSMILECLQALVALLLVRRFAGLGRDGELTRPAGD
jgi:uncharacterized membrane protein YbhN (UPF0104 family)